MALGNRAHLAGLNIVGLKRRGFSRDEMHDLRRAYRLLFADEGSLKERLEDVAAEFAQHRLVHEVLDFIRDGGERGFARRATDRGKNREPQRIGAPRREHWIPVAIRMSSAISVHAVYSRYGAVAPGLEPGPIAVLCAGGSLPFAVIEAMRAAGRQMVIAIEGIADQGLAQLGATWVSLGQLAKLFALFGAKLRRGGAGWRDEPADAALDAHRRHRLDVSVRFPAQLVVAMMPCCAE